MFDPLEWDTDALQRKYSQCVCLTYDEAGEKHVSIVREIEGPATSGMFPTVILEDLIKIPAASTYRKSTAQRYWVRTKVGIEPPFNLMEGIQERTLAPLSFPCMYYMSPNGSLLFSQRRMFKSFKAGFCADNRESYHVLLGAGSKTNEPQENAYFFNSVFPYKGNGFTLYSPEVAEVGDQLFVLEIQVGFRSNGRYMVKNPAMRKLLTERFPEWTITSW